MSESLGLLYSLKGTYSLAFVLFWGVMLVACVGLWVLSPRHAELFVKLERAIYWGFGALMIVFVAVRPLGFAPDDLAYLDIYKGICPTFTCGRLIQSSRDWGWYSSVGLLKSLYDSPRLMLWIAGLALSVKLWVIFNLSKKPMLALALFFGVFYQVQDVTALRVSLSLSVFMGGLWLVIKKHRWQGSLVLLSSFLFHKQAIFSPLVAVGGGLRSKFWMYPFLILFPVVIAAIGIYPNIQSCLNLLSSLGLLSQNLLDGFSLYVDAKANGGFAGWRVIPFSLLPIIFLMLILGKPAFGENKAVAVYASASCILACWLLWVFSDIPAAQVRFFEYFALPIVLLAGNCRGRWWEICLVLTVSSVFIYRYNVWTQLFVG